MDTKVTILSAKVLNEKMTLKLSKENGLSYILGKFFLWQSELANGYIVSKWYKATYKGTKYNIRIPDSQEEYDRNCENFSKLIKVINTYSEFEIKRAMAIIRQTQEKST